MAFTAEKKAGFKNMESMLLRIMELGLVFFALCVCVCVLRIRRAVLGQLKT